MNTRETLPVSPGIRVSPSFSGHIVLTDLLQSQGTIEFISRRQELEQGDGLFFEVEGDDFRFFFGVRDGVLIARRQEALLNLSLRDLPDSLDWLMLRVTWNFIILQVTCGSNDEVIKERHCRTQPTAAPTSLLRWAREQNLLRVIDYDTASEFRARVYSCLETIQDKVDETGAVRQFWNFSYSGNRIIGRLPKNETDVHGAIHCVLSDQMFLSSIDVVPEYRTGVGNLDFTFKGFVKDEGPLHVCAEFKNAHSADIFDGLERQLPLYMRNSGAQYGAYCVLGYKGSWFDEPSLTLNGLEAEFRSIILRSEDPLLRNVRIFAFDLSKPRTASQRKRIIDKTVNEFN